MKIKKLIIKGLHGEYNYDVNFNDDITFLYGSNGCGKTTILNILESITTGKIYRLFEFKFSDITLNAKQVSDGKDLEFVCSQTNEEGQIYMNIIFNEEKSFISKRELFDEKKYGRLDIDDFEDYFFSRYSVATKIKEKFNYVYIPLSRKAYTSTYTNDKYLRDYEMYNSRRQRRLLLNDTSSIKRESYLNTSLRHIEALILDYWLDVTHKENEINEAFKSQVLTSLLKVSREFPMNTILQKIDELEFSHIEDAETAYIQTLIDIKAYSQDTQTMIKEYFEKFKESVKTYKKKENDIDEGYFLFDLIWQCVEFLKIEKIVNLAQYNKQHKENVRKPIEKFLNVINDFFYVSDSNKKANINNRGEVYFKTSRNKLSLSDLSSGEKQLVITFANLIFGFKKKEVGIFIVDEPEASLHLEWQSKFVPKILELDKNIQLIFATHSPELIGRYRRKAVKLVKQREKG